MSVKTEMKLLIIVLFGYHCLSCSHTLKSISLSLIGRDPTIVLNDKNCPLGKPLFNRELSIIERGGYTLGYSNVHKTSLWVCEEITKEELAGNAKRKNRFSPDPTIPSINRAELADYRNSGYDRGHLAAADNYKNDQGLNDETFFLSNISPQIHSFNAGIWKKLEQQIRDWVKLHGKIYVVTGPLYLENSQEAFRSISWSKFIGKNNVGVPSHFYKILVRGEKDLSVLAFVIRHEAFSSKVELNTFLTSIDWIEEHSGINFLPVLPVTEEYIESKRGKFW